MPQSAADEVLRQERVTPTAPCIDPGLASAYQWAPDVHEPAAPNTCTGESLILVFGINWLSPS